MNRRTFLQHTAAAGTAVASGVTTRLNASPAKNTSIRNSTDGKLKIGLYSISYLGIWYAGRPLSFREMVDRAKEYGYDGIELDNKRPLGNPMDLDMRRRDELRNIVEKAGLEIPCVAANNDFSSPIPEHRECQLLMVKETARLAADLGAKVVRLFAAWPGVPIHNGIGTYDLVRGNFYSFEAQYPFATRLDRWNFTRECLKEAAAFGEEFGVVMALQNHAPLLHHWKDCCDIVREVDSPWLKICLDVPIMTRQDPEWVREAALTVGDLQVHSHFGGEYERDESGTIRQKVYSSKFGTQLPDYPHFVALMKNIGYEGYFTYELCHAVLNDKHEPAGLEYVHEQVKLAREFMRTVIETS